MPIKDKKDESKDLTILLMVGDCIMNKHEHTIRCVSHVDIHYGKELTCVSYLVEPYKYWSEIYVKTKDIVAITIH